MGRAEAAIRINCVVSLPLQENRPLPNAVQDCVPTSDSQYPCRAAYTSTIMDEPSGAYD